MKGGLDVDLGCVWIGTSKAQDRKTPGDTSRISLNDDFADIHPRLSLAVAAASIASRDGDAQ
jgi:hypothetical protein